MMDQEEVTVRMVSETTPIFDELVKELGDPFEDAPLEGVIVNGMRELETATQ